MLKNDIYKQFQLKSSTFLMAIFNLPDILILS
ncbi:hypothetical protein FIC_02303 [Flavobacteriaceae bacterium 3519-10]|nr:hypothetical protein FIC_02303 [Flavobacteriaceae bacterium 3519-10]